MSNEVERRCGICREWFPTGEMDKEGLRLGYCDEFPMAGLINEFCVCHGEQTPFKLKGDSK